MTKYFVWFLIYASGIFSIIQYISCKFHHQLGYIQVLMHFFFSYIARQIKFVAYLYPPQNNTSYDNLYKLCYKLYFTQVFISHNNFIFLNLELSGFRPIIFVFWNIFKGSLLFIFFWPIMFMSTSHDISMCKILI